jgi:hypothetical protein
VIVNVIILAIICGYSINGVWWLFHYKPLVAIDGYFIGGY